MLICFAATVTLSHLNARASTANCYSDNWSFRINHNYLCNLGAGKVQVLRYPNVRITSLLHRAQVESSQQVCVIPCLSWEAY